MLLQLEEMRKNEDPRLSFSTPEFKEAQRMFTDGLKVHMHAQQEHHSLINHQMQCSAVCLNTECTALKLADHIDQVVFS